MRRSRVTAAVLALALVSACGSDNAPGPDLLDDIDLVVGATAVLTDDGFDPATLTVEVGQLIEISNTGAPAEVASDDSSYLFGNVATGSTVTAGLRSVGTVSFSTRDGRELEVIVEAATPAE